MLFNYDYSYNNVKACHTLGEQVDYLSILKPVHNFRLNINLGVIVQYQPPLTINAGTKQLIATDMYTWMVEAQQNINESMVLNYVE